MHSFMATVLLQQWMREENFGSFLNDWGLELAGFNSAVCKFCGSRRETTCNGCALESTNR